MNISLEQIAYGSFPFWDRGYDVLAKSPGCRPEWASEVLSACRQFGEAPSGVVPCPCLFATRLPSGPWAVVGVEPMGDDDRGRPGALAFHALLIADQDYRRAGSNPFAFAGALRRDWSLATTLEARSWAVDPPETGSAFERIGSWFSDSGAERSPSLTDPRSGSIVEALTRGRRVALESAGPIEGLVREVWQALPESRRARSSVATWAFGNANRFDLVAMPRLAGVELDGSYVDIDSFGARNRPSRRPTLRGAMIAVALVFLAGLAWRVAVGARGIVEPPGLPASVPPVSEAPLGPEDRARIVEDLETLADRFEAFEIGRWGDPSELMARISDRLRYRGPSLSTAELARLAGESDPDRDRALAWHERLKQYAPDRPLPDDFDRLPLPSQLAEFARSFHLDPPARPREIPSAVAVALSREGPVRPTPLAARYPALSDYARFLGRLPRRGSAGSQ
ncbi:hypothetical protein P12x_000199 [Tundrisphaera lichenicola]|uniref:hypothetical protein n=1 Tax=Tundrisphaera lichenicola TaxID=2029860 RepID=UPI003EB8BB8A